MIKRCAAILGAFTILFGTVSFYNASAEGSTKFSIDTGSAVLQLSVPSNPAVINLNPTVTGGTFGSTTIGIEVATNNMTGYTLTMTPTNNQDNTSLIRTELVGSEQSYRTIPTLSQTDPVSTGYPESSFTANRWGYKITGDNYYGIDPNNTTVSHPAWVTNAPTNKTTHNLTLAAKVNAETTSGAYETTLNFSAVTNAVPLVTLEMSYGFHGKQKVTVGNEEYYKMQDMTTKICSYTNKIPSELQVVDIRDNKIYWIAKLADGHCWMTQNIDLDLETTPTHVLALTSENTDLNTFGSNGYDTSNGYSKDANDVITWTPERNTIPTSSISSTGSITGWTDDYNNPYSIDTGDWYWIGNWKNNGTDTWYNDTCTSEPWCNYLSGNENDKFSTNTYIGNGRHGHVGNYYNWPATIASNNSSSYNASTLADITYNPQNSICPSGWRLPTVSNASDTDGSTNEFRRLVTLYGNITGNDKALTAAPLWFVRGGYATSSSLRYSGSNGYYWSSTVHSGSSAHRLRFGSSDVDLASYVSRVNGRSVRCVAR